MSQPAAPSPGNDVLQAILDRLGSLPDQFRQSFTDHMWAEIPSYVSESQWSGAQLVNTPLIVPRQNSALILITSVFAAIPTGATGRVQLGSIKLGPLPAGVTAIADVQQIIAAADPISLTLFGGGGECSIWCTGRILPTAGFFGQ